MISPRTRMRARRRRRRLWVSTHSHSTHSVVCRQAHNARAVCTRPTGRPAGRQAGPTCARRVALQLGVARQRAQRLQLLDAAPRPPDVAPLRRPQRLDVLRHLLAGRPQPAKLLAPTHIHRGARTHAQHARARYGVRACDDRIRGGGIRRRRQVPSPPPIPPTPPLAADVCAGQQQCQREQRLLLTRRARNALGTATQYGSTREESASRSPRAQRGAARAPAVPPRTDAARLLGQLARADGGGRGGGGGGCGLDDLNGQGGAFFVRRLRRRALHPPATAGSLDTHSGPMTRSDLGVPAFDDLEARAERLQRCVGDRRRRRGPAAAGEIRLLLTRRARNASGTATQCTRRNDAPAHPGAPATACAGRSHPRRRRRRHCQCPPPPPPPARPPDARSTPPDTAPRCRRPRRSRRLLTRRARNASGTATQSTRGKDSPSLVRWSQPRARAQPRTPRQSPCSTTLALSCSGGAAAALADPSVGGGSA
jgi:hypothetical protein